MPDDLPAVIPATARSLAAVPPRAGGSIEAFVPRTIEEIKWTVGLLIEAGLAPDSFKGDPKKITVAVLKGLECGLPPLAAVSNIAVINGRASIWGDAALALVQSRSVIESMEVTEIGTQPDADAETGRFAADYGFEVKIYRRGQKAPYTGKFTVGDARRAKLWMNPGKAPWMQHPKRMLKIRATAFPLRDGFADCLAGLSIREEIEDLPPAPAAITATDFLDDAAPPKQIAPPSDQSSAPAPTADGPMQAEPKEGQIAQAGQSPAAADGASADAPSVPLSGTDDQALWAREIILQVAVCKSIPDLDDLRFGIVDELSQAPRENQDAVNKAIAEKRKGLGK